MIDQSFVDKLSIHCRNHKEQITYLPGLWFKVIKDDPNLDN